MKEIPHILIFDSGAGGLTVTEHIIDLIPHSTITYLADNEYFPYGNRPDNQLLDRILTIISTAIQSFKPDLVVIACNTASTIALDSLRTKHPNINFVGTVPAIKPASEQTNSGYIGVLATPATVKRDYTYALIDNHAKQRHVFMHGSDTLVEVAENFISGQTPNPKTIFNEVQKLLDLDRENQIDIIVLACTHFPVFKDILRQALNAGNKPIQVIDSGEAIARRVQSQLKKMPVILSSIRSGHIQIELTCANEDLAECYSRFLLKKKTLI